MQHATRTVNVLLLLLTLCGPFIAPFPYAVAVAKEEALASARPNIVLLMADDLGDGGDNEAKRMNPHSAISSNIEEFERGK